MKGMTTMSQYPAVHKMQPRPSQLTRSRRALVALAAAAVAVSASACGASGGSDAASGAEACKGKVTVVAHTGPGGGADVLSREIIALLEKENLIKPGTWTVDNREGGDGAVAMNFMREQAGRGDMIEFMSVVNLTNAMVTPGVDVSTLDLTPLVSLYDDRMAAAVKTDGPYKSFNDFVEDAKRHPDQLVQSGGSSTSFDAMISDVLQRESGAKWQFLSFSSGGDRRTALIRGDAQLYMTEPADMQESVKGGEMVPVLVAGTERSKIFPDTPTSEELGYTDAMPVSTRGMAGPPEMTPEASQCYIGLFTQLSTTASFKDFITTKDVKENFQTGDAYRQALEQQHARYEELFKQTGQLVQG
jgi:putative tricarboxylic transport membrane protein